VEAEHVAAGRTTLAAVTTAAVLVGGLTLVAVRRDDGQQAAPSASRTPTPTVSPLPVRPDEDVPSAVPLVAGAPATPAGIRRALGRTLGVPELGSRVSALVVDAATGTTLYASQPEVPVVPASTTKLFTAVAALHVLGPDRRIETRLHQRGTVTGGVLTGELVLVGGGDSTVVTPAARPGYPPPAQLRSLAAAVRRAGITRVTGGVVVDASVFAGPRLGPAWKPTYVSEGSVAPVSGLMVDSGKLDPAEPDSRSSEPDLAAGRALLRVLKLAKVGITQTVTRGRVAPADTQIAAVQSPPVSALVERVLSDSDNNLAEALGRLVAIERGEPPSFSGATAAMRAALDELGVGADAGGLRDASGLSPLNRVTAGGLVRLLTAALDPERTTLRPFVAGLPVSAFDGTLGNRYTDPPSKPGAGRVRAKTGSLDGVSTLAGVVETASGRLLIFAMAADRLPGKQVGKAAKALDAAVAALSRCGCAA
jgi:D-alanyl-D-alanine carboxypeptidase/D-alanyl-D-alanine-endopeptidase (penicillin-binding protein 4)